MTTTSVILGEVDCANYTLTVVAEDEHAAREALTVEYKRATRESPRVTPWPTNDQIREADEKNPLDYLGARFTEMTLGAVQWR